MLSNVNLKFFRYQLHQHLPRKCQSSAMSPGWTGEHQQKGDRNLTHITTVGLGFPPVSQGHVKMGVTWQIWECTDSG